MSWFEKVKRFFSFKRSSGVMKEPKLNETATTDAPWWGHYTLEEEQSRFFKVGNIVLCLDRYNSEWHITSYRNCRSIDLSPGNNEISGQSVQKLLKELPQNIKPYKKLTAFTSNEIVLKPILPDRSLLTPLSNPYYILPGQSLSVYVQHAVWVRIKAGKPHVCLVEIPTKTMSDSWFGTDTLTGELCYEASVECSTSFEDFPKDMTQVITPISIENQSKEILCLTELKIPLPFLSIFCDPSNQLWTEEITIKQEGVHFVDTHIGKGPPKIINEPKLLTKSRSNAKSTLMDLLSSFTGK